MSAANINVVVISGNLTRDPELRHTQGGTAVCDMRVAVNSRRKVGEEWVDKPNFFDVTVFGGLGENCAKYLGKGRPVTIDGRLDWSEWETKEGAKRQAVRIIADTVQFGPKKPDASGGESGSSEQSAANNGQQEIGTGAEPAAEPEVTAQETEEEDIPF